MNQEQVYWVRASRFPHGEIAAPRCIEQCKTPCRSLTNIVYPNVTLKLLFSYHREWWLGTCVCKSKSYFPQFWIKKIRKLWVPWILPLGWSLAHPEISEISVRIFDSRFHFQHYSCPWKVFIPGRHCMFHMFCTVCSLGKFQFMWTY